MKDPHAILERAIMPFGGGLRKFVPWFLATARQAYPLSEWDSVRFNDMTSGSTSCAVNFRLLGMRVVANDLAMRTYVTASALFCGRHIDKKTVSDVLSKAKKDACLVPDGKKTAHDLVGDTIIYPACLVFDALYYAYERGDIPEEQAWLFRYLALRWVLAQKGYMYFVKPPTFDLEQLAIQTPGWAKIVAMSNNPMKSLSPLIDAINGAVRLIGGPSHAKATMGDCREVIKTLEFGDKSITNLNPPTAGNAFFMQSNRVLDTLLFNEPQKVDDDDLPTELWKSIIYDSGKHVPSGHYIFSWCGDGDLTWEEGCETYDRLGERVAETTFPWKDSGKTAGICLIRKS